MQKDLFGNDVVSVDMKMNAQMFLEEINQHVREIVILGVYKKFQIRYNSLCIYNQVYYEDRSYCDVFVEKEKTKGYTGVVTSDVKRRIRRAVDLLLQCSPEEIIYNPVLKKKVKFKVSFVTLTISNNDVCIDGKFGYENLLKPYLQWLQKTIKINHYIWKAEVQKRGQLHYHITLNKFLEWSAIRDKWNYLQRVSGVLNSWLGKTNNFNPNSTDVHSVYKIRDLKNYLSKYLSKEGEREVIEQLEDAKTTTMISEIIIGNSISCYPVNYHNRFEISGKTWDCSKVLKGKKFFTVNETDINYKAFFLLKKNENNYQFTDELCTYISGSSKMPTSILTASGKENYKQFIESLKHETVVPE